MKTATAIISVALIAGPLAAGGACAQQYPAKPVRFVLPFGAPGGAPDITARTIAAKLTETWGQQIVIEPHVGAGATIGTEVAANARPDGYTTLSTSPSQATNATLTAK